MATEGEIVNGGTFATQIEDTDLVTIILLTFDKILKKVEVLALGSGTPRLYLDLGYGLFLQ